MVAAGASNITVTGNCTGSTTGAGVGVQVASTGVGTSHIEGSVTGNAVGTGTGIKIDATNGPSTITGDCDGTTTGVGDGILITTGATITGDVTGTCGTGGNSVNVIDANLLGDILLTSNPLSSLIQIVITSGTGKWKNIADDGPGKIRAATGSNIIQFADAQEFCPTANVVAADYVLLDIPRYTTGESGNRVDCPIDDAHKKGTAYYGAGGTQYDGNRVDCPIVDARRKGTAYYGADGTQYDGIMYGDGFLISDTKIRIHTIVNISKQPVSIMYQPGTAAAVGDVPMTSTGVLTILPGKRVTIESDRVDVGQIQNLKSMNLISIYDGQR